MISKLNTITTAALTSVLLVLLWAAGEPALAEIAYRSNGPEALVSNEHYAAGPMMRRYELGESTSLINDDDATSSVDLADDSAEPNKWLDSSIYSIAERRAIANELYCAARAASKFDKTIQNRFFGELIECLWNFSTYIVTKPFWPSKGLKDKCCYLDIFKTSYNCRNPGTTKSPEHTPSGPSGAHNQPSPPVPPMPPGPSGPSGSPGLPKPPQRPPSRLRGDDDQDASTADSGDDENAEATKKPGAKIASKGKKPTGGSAGSASEHDRKKSKGSQAKGKRPSNKADQD